MKKAAVLMLILGILLSLCACGGEENADTDPQPTAEPETQSDLPSITGGTIVVSMPVPEMITAVSDYGSDRVSVTLDGTECPVTRLYWTPEGDGSGKYFEPGTAFCANMDITLPGSGDGASLELQIPDGYTGQISRISGDRVSLELDVVLPGETEGAGVSVSLDTPEVGMKGGENLLTVTYRGVEVVGSVTWTDCTTGEELEENRRFRNGHKYDALVTVPLPNVGYLSDLNLTVDSEAVQGDTEYNQNYDSETCRHLRIAFSFEKALSGQELWIDTVELTVNEGSAKNWKAPGASSVKAEHVKFNGFSWSNPEGGELETNEKGETVFPCTGYLGVLNLQPEGEYFFDDVVDVTINGGENEVISVEREADGSLTVRGEFFGPHDLELTQSVEATCLKAGSKRYVCRTCGKEILENTGFASHQYSGWHSNGNGTHSASCSVCGKTVSGSCSGGWSGSGAGTHSRSCSTCGAYLGSGTCSDGDGDGLCDACGQAMG